MTPNEAAELIIAEGSDAAAGRKLMIDAIEAYEGEHGYAVSYFANLVDGEGDSSLGVLKIDDLIHGISPRMTIDPSGLEGILPITLRQSTDSHGRNYYQAVPTRLKRLFE